MRQQIGGLQQQQQVHASVVSVHRAVPVEITCNSESPRGGSGVLINNRVVLPPIAPHKKSSSTPYYVTLADDEEGTLLHIIFHWLDIWCWTFCRAGSNPLNEIQSLKKSKLFENTLKAHYFNLDYATLLFAYRIASRTP